jgi:hypothetical protein
MTASIAIVFRSFVDFIIEQGKRAGWDDGERHSGGGG